MCQIVIYQPGDSPKNFMKQCQRAEGANMDGNGFAQPSRAVYDLSAKEVIDYFDETKPAVFHARISTSGKSRRMLHPFKIKGGYLFHNGVLGGRFKGNEIFSDTSHFAEFMNQNDITASFLNSLTNRQLSFLLPEIKGNRLAVLSSRGKISTFGEGWQRVNGILCCGTGCTVTAYNSRWQPKVSEDLQPFSL